jgi:hypothetical protein
VNLGSGRERRRLPVSEGLCGAAVRSGQPVLVGDVREDPRYVSLVPETRSELVVPLVVKDRVIGVLDLESPRLHRFTDEHVKVLTPLASQVAIAVENARLYEEIRRRDERLHRELRIARDIQLALFPEKSPAGAGWQASAHFRPARELGGDLYDFYDMGGGLLGIATGLLVIGVAVALARRNYLGGRADRRGALRLGSVVFGLHLALWASRSQHFAALAEVGLLLLAICNSIFMATVTWLLYLALEPYVRKHWPQAIISWSRLLAGRFRDPLVGRDLLSGVLLGLLWALIFHVFILVIQGHGASPQLGYHEYLLGGRRVVGTGLTFLIGSIRGTLVLFFVAFLLRALLHRTWLVGIAFVLLLATPNILASRYLAFEAPAQLAVYTIAFVAVARFGLVTLAAGMLTTNLLMTVPVASSLTSWYAGATVFVVASVLVLAGWGFYTSLAGQKLWSGEIFE